MSSGLSLLYKFEIDWSELTKFSPVVFSGVVKKGASVDTGQISALSFECSGPWQSARPLEQGTTRPIPLLKCVDHHWSSARGHGLV
jgi:hypothetical protein